MCCRDSDCRNYSRSATGYCCPEHEARHALRRARKREKQAARRADPAYRAAETKKAMERYADPDHRERVLRRERHYAVVNPNRFAHAALYYERARRDLILDSPKFRTGETVGDLMEALQPSPLAVTLAGRLRELVGDLDAEDVPALPSLSVTVLRAQLVSEGLTPGCLDA